MVDHLWDGARPCQDDYDYDDYDESIEDNLCSKLNLAVGERPSQDNLSCFLTFSAHWRGDTDNAGNADDDDNNNNDADNAVGDEDDDIDNADGHDDAADDPDIDNGNMWTPSQYKCKIW